MISELQASQCKHAKLMELVKCTPNRAFLRAVIFWKGAHCVKISSWQPFKGKNLVKGDLHRVHGVHSGVPSDKGGLWPRTAVVVCDGGEGNISNRQTEGVKFTNTRHRKHYTQDMCKTGFTTHSGSRRACARRCPRRRGWAEP